MRNFLSLLTLVSILFNANAQDCATITLQEETLMHEMRATPSPDNGDQMGWRSISLLWPLPEEYNPRGSGLDGLAEKEHHADRSQLRYKVRYGRTANLEDAVEITTRWPMYTPEDELECGRWYWQYGYVNSDGTEWSDVIEFEVKDFGERFTPPALSKWIKSIPQSHPRVILDGENWDEIISRSEGTPERKLYLRQAEKILKTPMLSVDDIAADRASNLKNEMQRNAMLTRESRRIIDKEEANTNILIRAYLLTRDQRYADEALLRVRTIASWSGHKNIKGDFNDATMLSLCSELYDACYNTLSEDSRNELLGHIRHMGEKMYKHHQNRLECHIADNHVWQMTLRILTMAAFTVYGEIEEADTWTEYCYNVWLARLPGLNRDGAWHNGDSYFHVNIRTLIEVPFLYSRLSGYDFFKDSWYEGNALYVIYQQPPFSKSGGNGSSHQKILKPNGPRVSYAEALARLTQNSYAADYVRTIQAQEPNILMQNATGKSGGLAWWRLQCDKQMPTNGPGLEDLAMGKVFHESGLASFSTDLKSSSRSAMLSFRSSPYGSTSHAISNQNAFNTFYGGKSLFYSSGHHVAFVDRHAVFCHRASRAHNTILPDGKNQRIGTEGYGWIPRHYVGDKISYVVGDASNAYGEVISDLWLERAKAAEIEFSPETGWDKCSVKRFRRHIAMLGDSGYAVVYDELEAEEDVEWQYLLHAVEMPITFEELSECTLHIKERNEGGESDAYLYGCGALRADTTSKFFTEAVSWLRMDEKGNYERYPDHYHFTARSEKSQKYRFLTIVYTHSDKVKSTTPKMNKRGEVELKDWSIRANLSCEGESHLEIRGRGKHNKDVKLTLGGNRATLIEESGKRVTLCDEIPQLEI